MNVELSKAEAWMDSVAEGDDKNLVLKDTSDLSQVALLADKAHDIQSQMARAVEASRVAGRSWTEIGHALGVSRQAARQRFGNVAP